MSQIEAMLHVLRMPEPDSGPAMVTWLSVATVVTVVLVAGGAVLLGLARCLP